MKLCGTGFADADRFHAINRAHIHDIHATGLHLLGLNHVELTYFHNGRFEPPTVNDGEVVKEVLATA